MNFPECPLDITYCTATDCQNKDCERHSKVLEALKESAIMVGATVSVADFSGTCRDYIRQLVEEAVAV